jgi:hypothetical protein
MLGDEIEIKEASEPSDIIWENRQYTTAQRTFKKLVMSIIISILLLLSFSSIFYCSKWSLSVKEKYPKVNCAELNEEMKDTVDLWQKNAIQEFLMN